MYSPKSVIIRFSFFREENSVFVDERFIPYEDQWEFLDQMQALGSEEISKLVTRLCPENELGYLKAEEPVTKKPWERSHMALKRKDFQETFDIVKSGMLYLDKKGFSQKALNVLKRLAAFNNPEFYKA